MKGLWFLLLVGLVVGFAVCQAGQMYKYKDGNGTWAFSDKPPEKEKKFETLAYVQDKKPTSKIKLQYVKETEGYTLQAKSSYYIPVEIAVTVPGTEESIRKLIPARGSIDVLSNDKITDNLTYQWALGDPDSIADKYPYHAPFTSLKGHKITQGFNGRFSHTSDYSKYAVDIAMDVGTYLTAVRAGTVIRVKDDYHMSGTTRYFLDKANVIQVLHDDGTFASYAHILMDTAIVKAGDKVELGDRLARSGSSGFSTGPHLHFSIVKNTGLKNISIPFKFVDNNGAVFTPKRSMIMVRSTKP